MHELPAWAALAVPVVIVVMAIAAIPANLKYYARINRIEDAKADAQIQRLKEGR